MDLLVHPVLTEIQVFQDPQAHPDHRVSQLHHLIPHHQYAYIIA